MDFYRDDKIVIFGPSGSGKSNLAKFIILQFPCFIIYDPSGYSSRLGVVIADPNQIKPMWQQNIRKLVLDPPEEIDPYRMHKNVTFDKTCEILLGMDNLMFMVEEGDLYAMKWYIPTNFYKYVKYGRKRALGYMIVVQRTAYLHEFPISQATKLITFAHSDVKDLELIRKWFPSVEGRPADDAVRQLKSYHFIIYAPRENRLEVQGPCPLVFK